MLLDLGWYAAGVGIPARLSRENAPIAQCLFTGVGVRAVIRDEPSKSRRCDSTPDQRCAIASVRRGIAKLPLASCVVWRYKGRGGRSVRLGLDEVTVPAGLLEGVANARARFVQNAQASRLDPPVAGEVLAGPPRASPDGPSRRTPSPAGRSLQIPVTLVRNLGPRVDLIRTATLCTRPSLMPVAPSSQHRRQRVAVSDRERRFLAATGFG